MFQSVFSASCLRPPTSISAVSQLVTNYGRLIMFDGCVDTKSDHGFNRTRIFVESMEPAAEALGLRPADRSYRANFSVNYRTLFADNSRQYRVDILEASLEQNAVIWVNGDKFEFSAEAMTRAETMKQRWSNLFAALANWNNSRTKKVQLQAALTALDTAWAAFEQQYVDELIDIEARPRKLIMTAIEHEGKLKDMEIEYGEQKAATMLEYMHDQRCLVQIIAKLNSVANVRRKGRDDLSVEILWDAMKTIKFCDTAEQTGESTERLSAARSLSGHVVESFAAMRRYFRDISSCLERLDPQLCNNAGLVKRLVDWEESWEVGKHYVQNEQVLIGICDFVAEIRQAQLIAPELKSMCEDFDVEMFMVLPRILWLRGLARPGVYLHVFKSLLPHRFPDALESSNTSQEHWHCDSELQSFMEHFQSVWSLLASNWRSAERISDFSAWEVLVKRVALGSESKARADIYGTLSASVRDKAERSVESFMNTMEGWSMEMQRHRAEDWNMFMSIIIQCLSGGSSRTSEEYIFQV